MLFGTALLFMQHAAHEPAAEALVQNDARLLSSVSTLIQQQKRIETSLETLASSLATLQAEAAEAEAQAEAEKNAPGPRKRAAPADGPAKQASTSCPGRRPYHTVLTATGSVYQKWQSRIMYYHWKKNSALAGPCADAVGFTRLCATPGGEPDGLEAEIPSLFTVELSHEVLSRHFGFGVLNRPNSVRQLMEKLASNSLPAERVEDLGAAEYLLLLETDHVIMKPIPNLATPETPAAFIFGYMYANPSQDAIIKKYWPEGFSAALDPVGPSPLLIHRDQLAKVHKRWLDFSLGLRSNSDAERVIQGWVQEMWGYSIAAASLGIKHKLVGDFQVEPGALSDAPQLRSFDSRYYIFHYTYQFEYMMDGTPCQPWNIGEFSLDKRHFNDYYPTAPLPLPPTGANAAAVWLVTAFNEAMGAIPSWPSRQPAPGSGHPVQTVYGRRRLDWFSRHKNGFAQELQKAPLVKRLAGSRWACREGAGDAAAQGASAPLSLTATGDATGLPLGTGRWGALNDPTLAQECPLYSCVFVDFGRGQRQLNGHVDEAKGTLVLRPDAYGRRRETPWRCLKEA